jgi:FkbM family methyltransferase
MDNRNVFLYWIGKEYKLISILQNLIYLHSTNGKGYKVHLITETNINEYIKNIPQYFTNLCPAHQADFVRVNVICDYGGLWLDSDTIVIDSLDSLFDFIEKKNGFFIKQNNEILSNGVFGSKPNTQIMIEWKTQMMNLLNIKKGKINWCNIGNDMLQSFYITNPSLYDNYNIFNGLDNLYPVNFNVCVTEFIDKPYNNYKTIFRKYQPLVVLVNSVYKNLENRTEQEILEGNMPLNYFINKSFENLSISKNELFTNQKILNYGINDYISKSIIEYKCWEPNISNLFMNLIKNNLDKGDILDIGCNIGYFSLLSANNLNVTNVYSIDGNSNNTNMLNLSCKINEIKNIVVINKCISETICFYEEGNRELVKRVGNVGGLTFIKSKTNNGILSTTIDDLIISNDIKNIIIMKLDIEGGELNALKGATNTLRTNIVKNIIIEISPKFNDDSFEILKILLDNNYKLYNIPHRECGTYKDDKHLLTNIKSNEIVDIKNFLDTIPIQTNILAIKNQIKKYVIITDWIKLYLALEHFMFAKNLESFGWIVIELSKLNSENIEMIKSYKSIVLCITYDDFDISRLKCDNVQLIYKLDDLYPFKEIRNTCINNANIIISPYQYLFKTSEIENMYPQINNITNFHISYSAVNEFYSNIELNNDPIQKIFVSGKIDFRYPLRTLIKHNNNFEKYIDILDHPSYESYKHNIINEEYYKILNKYLCCFTDVLSYKYILIKIFEICSVGSLLLVEDIISDELNKLGFYDKINCIMCNKDNLEEKIKWVLDINNRKVVDEIREKGMHLVRNNHNTKQKAIQFNKIIENIISNKYLCKYKDNIYFTSDENQIEYINSGIAEPYSGNIEIVKNYIKNTKRNNTYIDVGVNIGTHSIVFSKLFSNIISFEPDYNNYNQSNDNIIINNISNITLYNNALGSIFKKISTKQHNNHSRGCIYTIDGGDIDCITLDSLNLTNVDYIKIDVEGNELDVLKGAINTIKNNLPIIEFEYNFLSEKLFNITYNETKIFLNNIGYVFDKKFESNYYFIYENKDIFENIYTNVPLLGVSSSIENNCKTLLDLGDLNLMSKIKVFNEQFYKIYKYKRSRKFN